MKKILGLALLIGCVSMPASPRSVVKYSGETFNYNVVASETFHKGICLERRIILRHKNKTRTNNSVDFVEAVDRQCDDTIENLRFRDYRDKYVDRRILEDDILFAFYEIKFNKRR